METNVWVVVVRTTHVQGPGCSCCADVEFNHTKLDSAWTDECAAHKRAAEVTKTWVGDSVTSLDDVDVEPLTLHTL